MLLPEHKGTALLWLLGVLIYYAGAVAVGCWLMNKSFAVEGSRIERKLKELAQ
jgi:hypothetical protein